MLHRLVSVALLGATLWTLHKVRKIHLRLGADRDHTDRVIRTKLDTVFSNLEALHAVSLDLQLRRSLPPTRGWAASPDFLRQIALHALAQRPAMVVECGSGVSTLILARCIQMNGNGHVYSLDHSPRFADQTRCDLERHSLSDCATVLDAPLQDYQLAGEAWPWYSLDQLPPDPIDMLVIDGPPGTLRPRPRYPAGPLLFPRLAPGAAVFLDDASREDEKAAVNLWGQEFASLRIEARDCEKGCTVFFNSTAAPARVSPSA